MDEHIWLHGGVVVNDLADRSIPRNLRGVGSHLPSRFFHYFMTAEAFHSLGRSGRAGLVEIGRSRSGDLVAVEENTGKVVLADPENLRVSSVINVNLEAFIRFMEICEDRYPYYSDEGDLDESIEFAMSLRDELTLVDPDALSPGSYWSDFISDVANGDYAEPVDGVEE